MESVNLHELPRKELKQLCNEHHIRTAGVKHDDLIRLLRNKLYSPAPDPPRLSKGHSQTSINSQTSSKSTTEYEETLTRSTSKVQTQGSLEFVDDLSQDDIPKRSMKELSPNPQLVRKPILTKSNLTPARRSDFLRKKVNTLSGLDNQSQERQPRQSDGSPGKSHNVISGRRKSIGSTSTVVNRPQERVSVKVNGAGKPQTNADAYSGATNSPRTSEGVASVTAVDSSDIGSHSIRSVSEIASDVGHRAVSEESDTDDLRSVSSEPAARFTSHINNLALRSSTGNKLGQTGVFSWDSGHERDSFKFPAGNNGTNEESLDVSAAPDGDNIFSYFLEDANSLVRSKSGPDSFLATPTADPGDVKRADERQVDSEQFLTPESSTAHHQERNTIDRKGSMREEVAFIHNNEAPLTDDLPESLSGDHWLVDYEIAPVSEKTEVVDANSVLPLSESEARIGNLNSSNGDLPVEKLDAIVDGDNDIASDSTESPGPSSEYVSGIVLASISNLSRSTETTEDISITLDSIPGILDSWVEHNKSEVECQEKEEPKSLSAVESSFPSDILSLLGNKLSSEFSDVLPHSGHITEEYCDNRGLEVECNSKASVEGVVGVEIAKSNEDQTEMLATSQKNSERTQAANLPMTCLSDEIGDVNDSSQHERSRVIATTPFLNFEFASHGYNQDGTSVGDAPCAVPDYIQDTISTSSEPVEDMGDVKWNSVSALYDNRDELSATDKKNGFGVFDHMLAETGESGSYSIRDFELQNLLNVRECEVANYAEPAATDVERHGVINEGNETASPSLSNVSVAQDCDLIQSEVSSKIVEQADVEEIFQDGSTGIALNAELFPPLMHTTEGEATSSHHQHERTRSDLNIPFALSSYQVSDMHPESGALFSASQHYIEPVNCSVDQVEGEESSKPADSLLQSSTDDVSGANLIRSFSQTWQNFEDFEDENTSTGVKEHTETWSDGIDQEGLELFIEQLPLAGEAESSTGLTDYESRMLSAQEQSGVHLQEDEQSLVAPDKFEVTSRDNTAASPHPPKLRQIFSVGLKVIFVIGSLTFGILRFRASRLRLQKRS